MGMGTPLASRTQNWVSTPLVLLLTNDPARAGLIESKLTESAFAGKLPATTQAVGAANSTPLEIIPLVAATLRPFEFPDEPPNLTVLATKVGLLSSWLCPAYNNDPVFPVNPVKKPITFLELSAVELSEEETERAT